MAANPTKNPALFDRKSGVTIGYPAFRLDAVIQSKNKNKPAVPSKCKALNSKAVLSFE